MIYGFSVGIGVDAEASVVGAYNYITLKGKSEGTSELIGKPFEMRRPVVAEESTGPVRPGNDREFASGEPSWSAPWPEHKGGSRNLGPM